MSVDVSAEALAEIDDPEVIRKLVESDDLNVAGSSPETDENTHSDNSVEKADSAQTALAVLYNRFLSRRTNRSPSTRAQYRRTIPRFIEYSAQNGVRAVSELDEDHVDSFVDWVSDEYAKDATVLTYAKNVRTWLKWLSKRNKCEEALYELLNKRELGLSPNARDEALSADEARGYLNKLRRHRGGTAMHALLELIWNGGPRLGDVHSLDLIDFHPDLETAALTIRHRPETGTRLKNGHAGDSSDGDGERDIAMNDRVVDALNLYIENSRPDVEDSHGREPLFATSHGRASKSTLRRWIYEATSCRWAPEISECEVCDGNCCPDSNVCPCSYYPHAIRRGSIVNHLSGDLRLDKASGRFDVSIAVLKKHYDPRTERERMEDRIGGSGGVTEAWGF